MQRRAVLRSLTAVTAAAATGLAGCNGDGGDGADHQCATPNGDLRNALPRGNGFTDPSVDANDNATEVGGATEHVLGSYITDDQNYLFVIAKYESNDAAKTAAATDENWAGFGYPVTGYIVVGKFAYVAMGPDEATVTDLMATAAPLDEDCATTIVFL